MVAMGETLDLFAQVSSCDSGPPLASAEATTTPALPEATNPAQPTPVHIDRPLAVSAGAVRLLPALDEPALDEAAKAWCDQVLASALAGRKERLKALRLDLALHDSVLAAIRAVAVAKTHAYRHAIAGLPVPSTDEERRRLQDAMWSLGMQCVDVSCIPMAGGQAGGV